MFETSPTTDKLDEALAKVQGEIEAAVKDKINPHFRSRYSDLSSMWEACRPALAKYGVSVTQWPLHSNDNRLHILTRVAFKGEWMRATFSMPVGKNDAQGFGSATTYAKRYTLSAALGIVDGEDDDGNAASSQAKAPIKNYAQSIKVKPLDSIGGQIKAIEVENHMAQGLDAETLVNACLELSGQVQDKDVRQKMIDQVVAANADADRLKSLRLRIDTYLKTQGA